MFMDNAIANQILERFTRLVEKNNVRAIMISKMGKETRRMHAFIHSLKGVFTIITSPAHIQMDGLQGDLKRTSLKLTSFPLMKPYSGCCVVYDVDTKSCERIYLEMFLNYEEADFHSIVKEFEQILSEKINTIKKKKTSTLH